MITLVRKRLKESYAHLKGQFVHKDYIKCIFRQKHHFDYCLNNLLWVSQNVVGSFPYLAGETAEIYTKQGA